MVCGCRRLRRCRVGLSRRRLRRTRWPGRRRCRRSAARTPLSRRGRCGGCRGCWGGACAGWLLGGRLTCDAVGKTNLWTDFSHIPSHRTSQQGPAARCLQGGRTCRRGWPRLILAGPTKSAGGFAGAKQAIRKLFPRFWCAERIFRDKPRKLITD